MAYEAFTETIIPLESKEFQNNQLLGSMSWLHAALYDSLYTDVGICGNEPRYSNVISGPIPAHHFENPLDCSICSLPIGQKGVKPWWRDDERGVHTTCFHVFHGKCLWTWISQPNCNTCPMCRKEFEITSFPGNWAFDEHLGHILDHEYHVSDLEELSRMYEAMDERLLPPAFLIQQILEINMHLRTISKMDRDTVLEYLWRAEAFIKAKIPDWDAQAELGLSLYSAGLMLDMIDEEEVAVLGAKMLNALHRAAATEVYSRYVDQQNHDIDGDLGLKVTNTLEAWLDDFHWI